MKGIDIPYVSLEHTLKCLKLQVIDSLPYIDQYVPHTINSPEKLFYFLKSKTKYINDPDRIELLQEVDTLMQRRGRGDCDCFTILALASCIYLGFGPNYVNIVGNSRRGPSHIYSSVYDPNKGKMCSMDLTNPYFDTERSYKFRQRLIFNI